MVVCSFREEQLRARIKKQMPASVIKRCGEHGDRTVHFARNANRSRQEDPQERFACGGENGTHTNQIAQDVKTLAVSIAFLLRRSHTSQLSETTGCEKADWWSKSMCPIRIWLPEVRSIQVLLRTS